MKTFLFLTKTSQYLFVEALKACSVVWWREGWRDERGGEALTWQWGDLTFLSFQPSVCVMWANAINALPSHHHQDLTDTSPSKCSVTCSAVLTANRTQTHEGFCPLMNCWLNTFGGLEMPFLFSILIILAPMETSLGSAHNSSMQEKLSVSHIKRVPHKWPILD